MLHNNTGAAGRGLWDTFDRRDICWPTVTMCNDAVWFCSFTSSCAAVHPCAKRHIYVLSMCLNVCLLVLWETLHKRHRSCDWSVGIYSSSCRYLAECPSWFFSAQRYWMVIHSHFKLQKHHKVLYIPSFFWTDIKLAPKILHAVIWCN